MKLFTSNRGAVSVFLVIILVPTLIVTSVFVDVSRMFLGKSVAESAGDLALNSQLSQFDKELNEMYGLFAKAQSVDDVAENLDKYFESCMVSAGVNTTDAEQYGQILSGLIDEETGENFSDLLQIDVSEGAGISAVDGANLDNPEVLKNQIVSFMKYRGPVDIAQNLLGNIKEVKNKTEIVEEEAEVTDNMNDYYESENRLLEHLKDAYLDIKNYTEKSEMTEDYIKELKTYITKLPSGYKDAYIYMFKNLYNTQKIKKIEVPTSSYETFNNAYNKSPCSNMSFATAKSSFKTYLSEVRNKMNAFLTTKSEVDSIIDEFCVSRSNTSVRQGDYYIQWYEDLYKRLSSNNNLLNDYYTRLGALNTAMAKLVKAHELLEKEEDGVKLLNQTPDSYFLLNFQNYPNVNDNNYASSNYETHYSLLYSQYSGFFTNPNNIKGSAMSVTQSFEGFKSLVSTVYDNYFKLGTSTENTEKYLYDVSKYLRNQYDKIESAKKIVGNAKSHLDDALEEYNKQDSGTKATFDKWSESLESQTLKDADSTVRNESKDVMDDPEYKKFREEVTPETIKALKTRLEKIETLLGNLLEYIDGVKFNNSKVKNINGYNLFKMAARVDESKIVRNSSQLSANAEDAWKNSNSFTSPNVSVEVTDENNPDITKKSPTLYVFLKDKFAKYDEDDEEDAWKKKYEELQKENDGEADEINDDEGLSEDEISDKEIGSGTEDPPSISKSITNVADSISGLFSGIADLVENPTSIRDDLYVLDYAMNMFSYHTYNKEGLYNLALAGNESGLDSISTVQSLRNKYKTDWENTNKAFTSNKSLTNFMINMDNNYSFGNEIEYIINGKSNDSNKSSIFGKIFLIRFAFNLAPEFSDNWRAPALDSIAGAVNGACPFIPAPLVKLVIILALTAAESGYDLKCLKEGMKVQLVKSTDDIIFTMNFSDYPESWQSQTDIGGKSASEIKGLQYSDYLTVFLFAALVNENSSAATIQRIGDVIARNAGMYKGFDNESEVFDMQKAVTHYSLTAQVKVSPLLLSIPVTQDDMNKVDSVSWWTWA